MLMDFIRYTCGSFWHFIAVVILVSVFGTWTASALSSLKGLFVRNRG